eukprot:5660729-Alexandrium_andersonii.AAC.1
MLTPDSSLARALELATGILFQGDPEQMLHVLAQLKGGSIRAPLQTHSAQSSCELRCCCCSR